MRRLGELWKELSTKDQEKYKTQAHKEWVAAGGPAAKKEYDAAKAIEKKEKAETKVYTATVLQLIHCSFVVCGCLWELWQYQLRP
jgi:hypothetical protein